MGNRHSTTVAQQAGIASDAPRTWPWALLVLIAALLAFQPALHNQYSLDDIRQVEMLPAPQGVGALGATLLEPWWPRDSGKALWRPLARLTIAAQKMLHPAWPAGFYGFNLLLHAAVSLVLFGVARGLGFTPRAAGLAGLLAAAHPLRAEAVHQVVGRAESIAALGMLLGLGSMAVTLRTRNGRMLRAQAIMQPLCFALALGGKEHALLYPLYLGLLVAGCAGGRELLTTAAGRRAVLALGGTLVVLGGCFLQARAQIGGGVVVGAASVSWVDNPLYSMPVGSRLAGGVAGLAIAAGQCVGLVPLAGDYGAHSFPYELGWRWPAAPVGLALLLGLIATLAALVRRAWQDQCAGRAGMAAGAAALIAGGLAGWGLTSNVAFAIGAAYAERLLYWPLVPVCFATGWALDRGLDWAAMQGLTRRLGSAVTAAVLAGVLLTASWGYAPAWRTSEALARHTLSIFPQSVRANINLARGLFARGQALEGRDAARRATQFGSDQPLAWLWLGLCSGAARAPEEARAAYARAAEMDPGLYVTWLHWARLERDQKRAEDAQEPLRRYLARATPAEQAAARAEFGIAP